MLSSEMYVHKHVCSIIICVNVFICCSTSIALYFFKTGLDIIKILKEKATLANKNHREEQLTIIIDGFIFIILSCWTVNCDHKKTNVCKKKHYNHPLNILNEYSGFISKLSSINSICGIIFISKK